MVKQGDPRAETATLSLAVLNDLPRDAARARLRGCCAAGRWVDRVVDGRPHASLEELQSASDDVFRDLEPDDLEEAMRAHPRIGERVEGADAESAWSRREQAAVADADRSVEAALHEGNVRYESRFGHVFLIFASDRSAEQMLAALHQRLDNDRDTEWAVIAEELRKITRLRLQRLVTT